MIDSNSRPPRKVAIAEHIWEAFEDMAGQMGSERDALINQAMFMFARLNGFIDASGKPNGSASNGAKPQAVRATAAPLAMAKGTGAAQKLDDDPVRREVAERVLETAAELERLIKGKNQQPSAPAAHDSADLSGEDEMGGGVDVEGGGAGALYLQAEGGDLDRISKDRFVIGRGKHCDFVINSGKVSREHAVIIRDAGEFFIEDLGSSNGTWFNKQRIKRRKIEDGDEYFICSEKVKLVFR